MWCIFPWHEEKLQQDERFNKCMCSSLGTPPPPHLQQKEMKGCKTICKCKTSQYLSANFQFEWWLSQSTVTGINYHLHRNIIISSSGVTQTVCEVHGPWTDPPSYAAVLILCRILGDSDPPQIWIKIGDKINKPDLANMAMEKVEKPIEFEWFW